MNGRLAIVGLGPGPERWITPDAAALLADATDLYGYGPYVARVPASNAVLHVSDNREELGRARAALMRAVAGGRAVIVSGGDPGVFAMAAAVFEAVEAGPVDWRRLDIVVSPGVTAMLAAAAAVGAPLGHDFCAINLSDNLKPWPLIMRRLRLSIEADFVIALYNPASRARPDRIAEAFATMLVAGGDRVVVLARAIGRPDERVIVTSLAGVDAARVDMATLVIIGSSATRLIERDGRLPWVYTPRRVEG